MGPPNPAHARCGPLPARRGPVAPAPGAGHGRTQLGCSGSRRASHRFPALALNAGTCSPTVPEPRWSRTARACGASYFSPGSCRSSQPGFFAGQKHPREQQLKPSSEWARKGPRTHPGARRKRYLKRPESSLLASARIQREKGKERQELPALGQGLDAGWLAEEGTGGFRVLCSVPTSQIYQGPL